MSLQILRGNNAKVDAYTPALAELVYNKDTHELLIGDGVTVGGVSLAQVASAVKLVQAFTLALTGAVTGTVNLDGSGNVSINTSVGTSLQNLLDAKAPLASPSLTGVPLTPTAAVGTNTTQVASTAFTLAELARYGLGGAGISFTNLTLQNSWAVIAGRRCAYRKVLGMLQIEFSANTGTSTDGTTLAILPVGFRPLFDVALPVVSGPNATPSSTVTGSRVVIATDGTIKCQNCSTVLGVTFSAILPLI